MPAVLHALEQHDGDKRADGEEQDGRDSRTEPLQRCGFHRRLPGEFRLRGSRAFSRDGPRLQEPFERRSRRFVNIDANLELLVGGDGGEP